MAEMDDEMDDAAIRAQEIMPVTSRIGRIAVTWARVEYLTNEIIWHLANVDIMAGACITSQIMSPSNRFRALIALTRWRGGPTTLLESLNKLSVKADGLARRRNRFIHDPWIYSPTGHYRVEVTADKSLKFEARQTDITELDQLADEISQMIYALEEMQIRIISETPAWPEKQYKESQDKDPTWAILNPDNGQ